MSPANDDGKPKRIIVSIVCMLAGMVTLSVGIVARVQPELIFKIVRKVPGTKEVPATFDLGGIITASAVFMIILGAVVTVVGLLVLIIQLLQNKSSDNKKPMIAFIAILVVILLAQLSFILFAVAAPEKLKENAQKLMMKSLNRFKEDIRFVNGSLKLPNRLFSLGWTVLQFETNCCGAYNYTDYSKWNQSITIKGRNHSAAVPISCCAKNNSNSLASSENYDYSIFTNLEACLKRELAYINQQNCYDSVREIVIQSQSMVIGVLASIIGEQVLLISLAVAMYCQTKKVKENENEIKHDLDQVKKNEKENK